MDKSQGLKEVQPSSLQGVQTRFGGLCHCSIRSRCHIQRFYWIGLANLLILMEFKALILEIQSWQELFPFSVLLMTL